MSDLERKIAAARRDLLEAPKPERRVKWLRFHSLLLQRSPEWRAEQERRKGLQCGRG